eukprot:SAG31_NODE_1762_length_7323_cov_10.940753_4_plen_88_part_00
MLLEVQINIKRGQATFWSRSGLLAKLVMSLSLSTLPAGDATLEIAGDAGGDAAAGVDDDKPSAPPGPLTRATVLVPEATVCVVVPPA